MTSSEEKERARKVDGLDSQVMGLMQTLGATQMENCYEEIMSKERLKTTATLR